MMRIFRISLPLLLTIMVCASCEVERSNGQSRAVATPQPESPIAQNQQSNNPSTPAPPSPAEMKMEGEGKYFADIFTKSDSLSYNGYEVVVREKAIPDSENKGRAIPVTYAVVKKGKDRFGKFDGVYFGLGNATGFGLFNFLGGDTKELAISQTVPRGGRHWVVRLHPYYKVIFDSANYEVGREEVEILDLDHDGIYEIALAVTSFYMVFKDFSIAETPLPMVIFKYDKEADSYLPANHLFQNQMLQATAERIGNLSGDPKSTGFVSGRVDILLDYLYAGKEKEGWSFFNNVYNLPDKELVEATVRKVLRKGRAYQFISRRSGKR